MGKAFTRLMFCFLLATAALPTLANAAPELAQTSIKLAERGYTAISKRDLTRAKRLLEEAMVADPANAIAIAGLAHVHQLLGNLPLARKYYASALTVDPANIMALGELGRIEATFGKREDAEDKLRRLQELCPTCVQTSALESALSSPAPKAPQAE